MRFWKPCFNDILHKKKKKVLFLWSNLVQHYHYPKALQNDPVAFSVGINWSEIKQWQISK